MMIELNDTEKLKLKIFGYVKIGIIQKEGWSKPSNLYAFKCPVHGLVSNTAHGYYEKVNCPECLRSKFIVKK